ncbi:MAG TPA: hypothetical protein VGK74_16995 [Symbiobacteriaceae bacterium]
MRRKIAPILVLIALVAWGCTNAGSRGKAVPNPDMASAVAAPGGDSKLNPHVTVGPGTVKITPDLPTVTPPAGWLSQAEIQQKAMNAVSANGGPGGMLTLTAIRPDEPNGLWVVEFATDGRQVSGPHSHPALTNWPKDPVEQRKAGTSDVRILSAITYAFDARTGEGRGGGFRGGAPDLSRSDLEHYRGRIVSAGLNVQLRLTRPDGTRDGRDLDVWVPQEALGNRLSLWQLKYGAGRQLEVWGLTGRPATIAAYRLSMVDPPGEELLQNDLVGDVPAYPEAAYGPDPEGWMSFVAKNSTPDQVWDWYAKQMPKYGWHLQDGTSAAPKDRSVRRSFRNDAWEQVTVEITGLPEGVRVRINSSTLP